MSYLRLRLRLKCWSSSRRGGKFSLGEQEKDKEDEFLKWVFFFYLGLERDLRENLEKRERRETKIEERKRKKRE